MSSLTAEAKKRPSRRSTLGNMNIGDTAVPSLTTMEMEEEVLTPEQVAYDNSSLLTRYGAFVRKHTYAQPLLFMLIAILVYKFGDQDSELHDTLEGMITISYPIVGTDQYGKGEKDYYFVGFYSFFFTFFRELLMSRVLKPFSKYMGITKPHKVSRFMEQCYSIIYYGIVGPYGLYVMYRTPIWYFNTTSFYELYPHRSHDFYFKLYYLGQAAFWVQQSIILILQLEKPRKDFHELVIHHFVTIALIWLSYNYHFTWMGLAIYITMDISDLFLSTLKALNYIESPITAPFFMIFVLVWVYLRHYINLKILWSVITEFRSVGLYRVNRDTEQYKFWISQPIVFFLILALQILNAYWLFLIYRIFRRYVIGTSLEDERSDDEDEDDEEEDTKTSQQKS